MSKKTIVVNLLGEPSSGKSTAVAYIFSKLKMHGVKCEYVTEYAKDKVYEQAWEPLRHQEYMSGKQSFKIGRVADKVDVVITDSPLILSVIYNKNKTVLDDNFNNVVLNMFNSYSNLNYFLERHHQYENEGRMQSESDAAIVRERIVNYLNSNNIKFELVRSNEVNYNKIVEHVMKVISNE